MLRRFIEDESGATAVEYGLIAVLISLAAIVGITALSNAIQFLFSDNNSRMVEAFSYH
ncbi:MAG: Flp family type IVb pilin [Rhizobiaceae bacterium]|jgi:pilus assembly protein Flp/PilA